MNVAYSLKKAIVISRPIFWPSTFFAFIFGVLFSRHAVTPVVLFYAFLWSFPYSLWLCTVNDLADTKTDTLNRYKGGIAGAKLQEKDGNFLKTLRWISLLTVAVPVLLTGNVFFYTASAAAVVIPYLYSAYPFRLKEKPPFDSLCNGAFVASVFLAGYVFYQPNHFTMIFFQALFGFFFGVSALHIIAAMRDYTPDKRSHIRTIAVVLGLRISAFIGFVLFVLVYLFIFRFPGEFRIYSLAGMLSCLFLLLKPSEKHSSQLFIMLLVGFAFVSLYSFFLHSWDIFFLDS